MDEHAYEVAQKHAHAAGCEAIGCLGFLLDSGQINSKVARAIVDKWHKAIADARAALEAPDRSVS